MLTLLSFVLVSFATLFDAFPTNNSSFHNPLDVRQRSIVRYAAQGNLEKFRQRLLSQETHSMETMEQILVAACTHSQIDILTALRGSKAAMNAIDQIPGEIAFHAAFDSECIKCLDFLLENRHDEFTNSMHLLQKAVQNNSTVLVKYFLSSPGISEKVYFYRYELFLDARRAAMESAIALGHAAIFRLLLDDCLSPIGSSIIGARYLASNGLAGSVAKLLDKGHSDQNRLILLAAKHKRKEIILMLLELGISPEGTLNGIHSNVIEEAVRNHDADLLLFLLDQPQIQKFISNDPKTLPIAYLWSQEKHCRKLIEKYAGKRGIVLVPSSSCCAIS